MHLISKYFFSLLVGVLFISVSYAQEDFQKSMVVPIAYGELEVEEIDRDEFHINLEVENLTEPENIEYDKRYYVVWSEDRKDTSKIGLLHYDGEAMRGALTTQTTLEDDPEYILISAESSPDVNEISELVVLKSEEL